MEYMHNQDIHSTDLIAFFKPLAKAYKQTDSETESNRSRGNILLFNLADIKILELIFGTLPYAQLHITPNAYTSY